MQNNFILLNSPMNQKKKFFSRCWQLCLSVAFCFCAFVFTVQAQENNLAIGQWRVHLPFNKLNAVAEGNGKIYCAATDGLFIYSLDDGNISRLTRLEGLSDFDIVHIRYNPTYHVLMVVYRNSNIDLIYDKEVVAKVKQNQIANVQRIAAQNDGSANDSRKMLPRTRRPRIPSARNTAAPIPNSADSPTITAVYAMVITNDWSSACEMAFHEPRTTA